MRKPRRVTQADFRAARDGCLLDIAAGLRKLTGASRSWPVLHFIGFRSDAMRFDRAVRVFGRPDFVHYFWDLRAAAEVMPGDVAVFAEGDEATAPRVHSYDDSANQ